jgi:hypothetical protein
MATITQLLLSAPDMEVVILQTGGNVKSATNSIASFLMLCVFQVLNALVGALGPELQTDAATRNTVMTLFAEFQLHQGSNIFRFL